MNTEHLSRGWALIAEGAQYISLAYASAIDPPLARSGVPASLPAADSEAGTPLPVSGPSIDDDMPPLPPLPNDLPDEPRLNPQVEQGLGKCPVHGKGWTVKAAGVNTAGKSYESFWRCNEMDDGTYCKQKPQKIWRDLHPIPNGVAA